MLPSSQTDMQKGFSLFEFVIYCGVAITLATLLVTAAVRTINEKRRLDDLSSVERSVRIAEKIIGSWVRSATTLQSPLAGATSTTLILSYATGTTPITLSLGNGAIEITAGTTAPQRITERGVSATNLEFQGISSSSTAGFVRTSFTLTKGTASKNFILSNNIYAH